MIPLEKNTADLRDVLDKLQEEMAEVIQAAAKAKSYGLLDDYSGKTNRQHLETELGDVLCIMNILVDNGVLDHHNIELACWEKAEKMKKWAPTVAKYWKGEE